MASNVIASTEMIESTKYRNGIIPFTLAFKKPIKDHLERRFMLTAVVNVGWEERRTPHPWLKKGDYLTTKKYNIDFKKNWISHEQNMEVVCYGKFK